MATGSAFALSLKSWVWATRPFSLTAAAAPVFVGSALAWVDGGLNQTLFALVLIGAVAIQVGTNLTDEYADHSRHGDESKFSAPHKVIERGVISPRAVLVGIFVMFGLAMGSGLYIVSQVGWPILAVGFASCAVALLYAGGPWPIGDTGASEVVVFVFMGPLIVMGAYYVQIQELTLTGLLVSFPMAFLVTAIMHCNNLRDVDEDRINKKRTMATMLSETNGRRLYTVLLASTYAAVIATAFTEAGIWVLLGLVTIPWGIGAIRALQQAEERSAMNALLMRTAGLHWGTGLAIATGLIISEFL